MADLPNICVILPSLDPDEKLLTVIDGLLEYGFRDILLVNDGSKAENLHYFETAAAHPEVQLLHHSQNLGKGAALKTAFRYFLENRPECAGVVTVDGDNQHHPQDTLACAEHMLQTGRLTLGVRDFSRPEVPFRSRAGNRITSLVFRIFVGMTISDTQTGLRAIPRRDVEKLIAISGDRFEYETNMLLAMKAQNIPFDEVKIRTVYIEENKSSHFRAVRDSWRIYKLILDHFFRYSLSSLLSAVVDVGLYALLSALLHRILSEALLTVLCTLGARAVSSFVNFSVNRKLVFRSEVPVGKAFGRYYALAIPMFFAQSGVTALLYRLLGIGTNQTFLRSLVYAVVMAVLFVISFLAQQRWVFQKESQEVMK